MYYQKTEGELYVKVNQKPGERKEKKRKGHGRVEGIEQENGRDWAITHPPGHGIRISGVKKRRNQ